MWILESQLKIAKNVTIAIEDYRKFNLILQLLNNRNVKLNF